MNQVKRAWGKIVRSNGGLLTLMLCGVIGISERGWGQIDTDIEIVVTNASQQIRTLHCGANTQATIGIDTGLGELSLPPFPPTSAFEARFVSHGDATIGQGSPSDFRPLTSKTQNDQYKIRFQPGGNGMPVKLTWNQQYIIDHYSVATISDPFGGIIVSVDMKTTSSLDVTNDALTELVLELTGPTLGVDEQSSEDIRTGATALWNASSDQITIRYELATPARRSISMVSATGQLITTIADEGEFLHGSQIENISTEGLASGTYFLLLRSTPTAAQQVGDGRREERGVETIRVNVVR